MLESSSTWTESSEEQLPPSHLDEQTIRHTIRRTPSLVSAMGSKRNEEAQKHVSGQSNKPISAPAHALNIEQVVKELKADVEVGLSDEEARTRLEEYGRNELGEEKGVQPVKIFIGQIANALTLVSSSTAFKSQFKGALQPGPSGRSPRLCGSGCTNFGHNVSN